MTLIHGKKYGVKQEMFNVSNSLFKNMFSMSGRVQEIIQILGSLCKWQFKMDYLSVKLLLAGLST